MSGCAMCRQQVSTCAWEVPGAAVLRQMMGRSKKSLEGLFSKWWIVWKRAPGATRLRVGYRYTWRKKMAVCSVSLQCHQTLPSVWHHGR